MFDDLSVFFGEDQNVLADVEAAATPKKVGRGTLLLGEGDESASVFYLLGGKASAIRYSVGGVEVLIDTFERGALLGEMAALTGAPRTADIYALTEVRLAVFSAPAFLELMRKHGSIGIGVSRLLAKRIGRTTHRMFEQSTLSSKGRVYAELMRMARSETDSGNQRIGSMPAISDLAKRLNIARETVSRTVNELKHDAIVRPDGPDLVILKPHALVSRLQ